MRMMSGLALAVLLAASIAAQSPAPAFPPGFVNQAPILAAAAKEIGEASLQCVTFSGTGYAGAVGQAFESADESIAPTSLLIFITIRFAVHQMPEGDVLFATIRHDILTIFIREEFALPHPAGDGIKSFGAHAPVIHPAGIGIM